MKDEIDNLFKNVFIGSMLLINLSLILYILFENQHEEIDMFSLDGSFWGALLGAIITGGIAIYVFLMSKIYDDKKSLKLVKNYKYIINKIHGESIEEFKVFLDAAKSKSELPDNYREVITHLLMRKKIFDLIDVNGLIKETEKAVNIIDYMIVYRDAVEMIDRYHGKYGNLFFLYIGEDNNKPNVNWLEEYISIMESSLKNI